jgi:hypothetical protein
MIIKLSKEQIKVMYELIDERFKKGGSEYDMRRLIALKDTLNQPLDEQFYSPTIQ